MPNVNTSYSKFFVNFNSFVISMDEKYVGTNMP
jgi:hypothetical protein